jgi:adenine-specific DNA-methyltransferase
LIKWIISLHADDNALVLDSFAGSGVTAHAVLELNKEDGGSRRFILVEMETEVAKDITYERVRRVAEGYTNLKGEYIEGLGAGFKYCYLGDDLFEDSGQIAKSVSFPALARFVFFKETGLPLPDDVSGKSSFIGTHNGTGVYLLYNGVLGDKTPQGGNALTRAVLADLPPHDGPKVVYGTSCRVGSARLKQENMIFRQIPYELKVD